MKRREPVEGQFWWLACLQATAVPSFLPSSFELVVLLTWVCDDLGQRTSWKIIAVLPAEEKEVGLNTAERGSPAAVISACMLLLLPCASACVTV